MPKSIWNGTVTFGMVNIPIKLYSATESKSLHFHEVHVRDGARIEHRRVCPKDDKEVPYKEIVKGYEISEGKYVVLDKGEIKAAAGDRGKVIQLSEFVDSREIDPVFFETTYYAGNRDRRTRSGCTRRARKERTSRNRALQLSRPRVLGRVAGWRRSADPAHPPFPRRGRVRRRPRARPRVGQAVEAGGRHGPLAGRLAGQ